MHNYDSNCIFKKKKKKKRKTRKNTCTIVNLSVIFFLVFLSFCFSFFPFFQSFVFFCFHVFFFQKKKCKPHTQNFKFIFESQLEKESSHSKILKFWEALAPQNSNFDPPL